MAAAGAVSTMPSMSRRGMFVGFARCHPRPGQASPAQTVHASHRSNNANAWIAVPDFGNEKIVSRKDADPKTAELAVTMSALDENNSILAVQCRELTSELERVRAEYLEKAEESEAARQQAGEYQETIAEMQGIVVDLQAICSEQVSQIQEYQAKMAAARLDEAQLRYQAMVEDLQASVAKLERKCEVQGNSLEDLRAQLKRKVIEQSEASKREREMQEQMDAMQTKLVELQALNNEQAKRVANYEAMQAANHEGAAATEAEDSQELVSQATELQLEMQTQEVHLQQAQAKEHSLVSALHQLSVQMEGLMGSAEQQAHVVVEVQELYESSLPGSPATEEEGSGEGSAARSPEEVEREHRGMSLPQLSSKVLHLQARLAELEVEAEQTASREEGLMLAFEQISLNSSEMAAALPPSERPAASLPI